MDARALSHGAPWILHGDVTELGREAPAAAVLHERLKARGLVMVEALLDGR